MTTPADLPEPSHFLELGATGLDHSAGFIDEEFHPDLRGHKAAQVFREMSLNEANVGAALFALEITARQVVWRTDAAKGSGPEGELVAAKFDSMREDMETRWSTFISEALTMAVFGFAPCEVVMKIRRGEASTPELRSKHDDGWIAPRKLALRAQDTIYRWEIDDTGEWQGLYQRPPPSYRERFIPRSRLLLFRTFSHKSNPEGRSLLRTAYKSYYHLKRIQELEGIGIERRVAGIPFVTVPPDMLNANASTAQKAAVAEYRKLCERIRRDRHSGLVMPAREMRDGKTGYDFGVLTTGGENPADVDVIVKRYETRILMSMLAEFIALGMDKVGSFALSSDKTDLFALVVDALLGSIREELNDVLIPMIGRANSIPRDLWPKYSYGDIEAPDLTQLSTYVATLLGAGAITGGPKLEQYLLEAAKLPAEADARAAGTAEQANAEVDPYTLTAEPQATPSPAIPSGVPAPAPIAKARTFEPNEAMRDAARRGLALREEWGRGGLSTQEAGAQGSKSGVARASSLANGDALSEESVRAMARFFARHAKNRGGPDAKEDDGGPTAGWIAWLLWGGDDGAEWSARILDEIEGEA